MKKLIFVVSYFLIVQYSIIIACRHVQDNLARNFFSVHLCFQKQTDIKHEYTATYDIILLEAYHDLCSNLLTADTLVQTKL